MTDFFFVSTVPYIISGLMGCMQDTKPVETHNERGWTLQVELATVVGRITDEKAVK